MTATAGLRAAMADLDPELVVAVDGRAAHPDLQLLDAPVVAWATDATRPTHGWFDVQAPAGGEPAAWVPDVLGRADRTPQFGCLLLRCRRAVERGLVDEAAQAVAAAERLRPGTAQVLNAMAVCAFTTGDVDRAVDLLRRALGVDPDHPTAAANLAALSGAAGAVS